MSNKEKIITLLEDVPEYKLGYILAYIQGITADDENDDLYSRKLAESYLNDPKSEQEETYTLEECKKEWGLD